MEKNKYHTKLPPMQKLKIDALYELNNSKIGCWTNNWKTDDNNIITSNKDLFDIRMDKISNRNNYAYKIKNGSNR